MRPSRIGIFNDFVIFIDGPTKTISAHFPACANFVVENTSLENFTVSRHFFAVSVVW